MAESASLSCHGDSPLCRQRMIKKLKKPDRNRLRSFGDNVVGPVKFGIAFFQNFRVSVANKGDKPEPQIQRLERVVSEQGQARHSNRTKHELVTFAEKPLGKMPAIWMRRLAKEGVQFLHPLLWLSQRMFSDYATYFPI